MKRIRRFWINTDEPRKDIIGLMILGAAIVVIYPWIARGVREVGPFLVSYYEWVKGL
jgi:hypothetical protein